MLQLTGSTFCTQATAVDLGQRKAPAAKGFLSMYPTVQTSGLQHPSPSSYALPNHYQASSSSPYSSAQGNGPSTSSPDPQGSSPGSNFPLLRVHIAEPFRTHPPVCSSCLSVPSESPGSCPWRTLGYSHRLKPALYFSVPCCHEACSSQQCLGGLRSSA